MVEGEKGVGGGVLCSGIGGAGLRGGECYDPVMPLTSSLPSRSCRHRSISSRAAIAPQGQ
uniref:Uncharacterized protein n=1 Tax=Oryza sativa subsp. japonica TaxID=39947 RepID=Q69UE2_ORYSJ|nr:hypothetical protein [Oryza sativa Japonica Group]